MAAEEFHVVYNELAGSIPVGVGVWPGTVGKITGGNVTSAGSVEGNAKLKYSKEEVETLTHGACTHEVVVESGIEEVKVVKVTGEEAEIPKFMKAIGCPIPGTCHTVKTTAWKVTNP